MASRRLAVTFRRYAAFEILLPPCRYIGISKFRNIDEIWRRRLFLDQFEFPVLDGDDGFGLGRQIAF